MKNSRRSDSRSLLRCSKLRPRSNTEGPLTVLIEQTSDRCTNLLVKMIVHLRSHGRKALKRLLLPSRPSRISNHLCTSTVRTIIPHRDRQPRQGTHTFATTAQKKGSSFKRTIATLQPHSALSKRWITLSPMCETVSTIKRCMS